ncbi:TetR/AcrR family transcriptional regulator [Aeromicrobium sp. UC242_57]|uniref:TetR/AcrR family transcriptional regulator n=1 Tax=Aeromicrobium sp. UC242_57 TaxID=3374624 RepID=UPI00379DB8A2
MASPVRITSQERSSARQRALVVAAARLLIDQGPGAVTHRAVAEAAGVPAGSANYYFPAKSQLYAEAVREAEEIRGSSALEMARALPQRNRSDSTTAILLIEVFYAPDLRVDVVPTRLEPMLAAYRDPDLRTIMMASRSRLLTALRITLESSGYHKVAAGPDVELLAQLIDASLIRAGLLGEKDPIVVAGLSVARLLELAQQAR